MYRIYLLYIRARKSVLTKKFASWILQKSVPKKKITGKCIFLVKKQAGILHRIKEIVTFALRKVGNVR